MNVTSQQRDPMRFEDELLPVLTAALAERQKTHIPIPTPRESVDQLG